MFDVNVIVFDEMNTSISYKFTYYIIQFGAEIFLKNCYLWISVIVVISSNGKLTYVS